MSDRIVVQYVGSSEMGGTERVLLAVALGLAGRSGWRPIVMCRDAPGLAPLIDEAGAAGIETLRLPAANQRAAVNVARLVRDIRAIDPAVFHAHLPWPDAGRRALLAATIARVPAIVATCHLVGTVESGWRRATVRLMPIDRYIAVSEAVAHGLGQLGVDRRRVTIVHNGTRQLPAMPAKDRRRRAAHSDRPATIATVGRLTEQKGQRVLLEALVGLPDVRLMIAGDGPLRAELEALAAQFDVADRVQFLGFCDDIPALLAKSDLFALTSINEGLPLAVLEAMAAGIPVVATRVGGIADALIDGETGILIEPGDVAGTRAAIRRLIDDPQLAGRLGSRAREVADERFSIDAMVGRVIDVYEEVLTRKAAGPRPPGGRHHRRESVSVAGDASRTAPVEREVRRNIVLRRADWRFLLPDPAPKTVVSYATGPLQLAVHAIAGRVVEPNGEPRDCDLAVVVDPSPTTLSSALHALRPTGVCYGEWHGPRAITRRVVTRRLAASGFVDVHCYWAWPGPSAARAWFPLDSPTAARAWVSTRASRKTHFGRMLQAIGWRFVRFALEIGVASPIVAVASKPWPVGEGPRPGGRDVGSIGPLDPGWIGAGARGAGARSGWLLLTGGSRTGSKVVGLAFAGPDALPRLAVKMNRTPESRGGVLREAEMLRFVEQERPSMTGVPRVARTDERDGLVLLCESPVLGEPLSGRLTAETYAAHAGAVAGWLIDLAGRGESIPPAEPWSPRVEPILTSFEDAFGAILGAAERQGCREVLDQLPDLPVVPEQRDMGPWNLVLAAGSLGVLDWESAEPAGMPVLDLIYFLTYAAFYVLGAMRSGSYREAYRLLRDPTTTLGRTARACLDLYCVRTGVPPTALPALHLVTWMVHAQSEHRRLVEDAGGPPTTRALQAALMPALWQTELALQPAR